jgi:hypothetical protein
MRSKSFIGLTCLLILVSGIFLGSCKKEDHTYTISDQEAVRIFFNLPNSSSFELRKIGEEIKKQENIKHFISDFVKTNGFPVWENSISSIDTISNKSSENSNNQIFLIPTIKNGDIKSYIFCLAKNNQYSFKVYSKEFLLRLNVSDSAKQKHIKDALKVFAYFEKAINAKNELAFNSALIKKAKNVSLSFSPDVSNRTSTYQLLEVEVCGYEWVPSSGYNTGLEPGQSGSYGEYQYKCHSDMVFVWVEEGGGGTGLGDPNGGSGGQSGGGAGGGGGTGGGGSTPTNPPGHDAITWIEGYPVLNDGTIARYYGSNPDFWSGQEVLESLYNQPYGTHDLTAQQLRNVGTQRGWDVGVAPITFNRKVGKAFEETALRYFGFIENTTNYDAPQRSLASQGNVTRVRPDALDYYQVIFHDNNGATHIDHLERTFAVEVKAKSGTLTLSSNQYQILGELERLRIEFDQQVNSPYWQQSDPPITIDNAKRAPCLLFITTSDCTIDQSIINKAAELKVNIWQVKARYIGDENKITFGPVTFVYDKSGEYSKGDVVPRNFLLELIGGSNEIPIQLELNPHPNFSLDPEELE